MKRHPKYPELTKISKLSFKAFQRSLKTNDKTVVQNALARLYQFTDALVQSLDNGQLRKVKVKK